jgi:ABC-type multidrug transport system permease subunit
MNIFAEIHPWINVGGSQVLSWMLTLGLIAAIVFFVYWLVAKLVGPPTIPDPFRWIIWLVVIIALLIFLFAALGIRLP